MSSASSNQLVVHDGADYEEVYLSGHKDQESPGEERSPSASSSSSTNEDMEMAELEDISNDGEDQPLRSIISANGLREFIMLPKWMVHKFTSVIKEKHFNTFRANSNSRLHSNPSTLRIREMLLRGGRRCRSVRIDAEGGT